jgi:hypothetical protein
MQGGRHLCAGDERDAVVGDSLRVDEQAAPRRGLELIQEHAARSACAHAPRVSAGRGEATWL